MRASLSWQGVVTWNDATLQRRGETLNWRERHVMAGEFFPRREGEFALWAKNLCDTIVADPEAYGIAPERAAALAAVTETFAIAYRRAIEPSTRTTSAVIAKNSARTVLEAAVRQISATVKGYRDASPGKVVELGLNPRHRGGKQTRIAKPDAAPIVMVESIRGAIVYVKLRAAGGTIRRGRAKGTKAAHFYSHVGDEPSPDPRDWRSVGSTVQTKYAVQFDMRLAPGTKVWITARWLSPTCAFGPAAAAVFAHIGWEAMLPRGLARQVA
jgi:hypothetical protein